MARYDDLTWWMNRPAGMTDETAARTYGTLSPLAGALAQTRAVDYGPDLGIGAGPGRKLVLKDPEELAQTRAALASLAPAAANPWAGRIMGDTIGGAQSNLLARRGQDLNALAQARAFAEQQRQFNITTQERNQARQEQAAAQKWARDMSAQARQAEVNQRSQDSMLDYLSSLARTDTQSRDAASRLAQQNWLASARSAGVPSGDGQLGELLRAQAELKAALADAEDEYGTFSETSANPSLSFDPSVADTTKFLAPGVQAYASPAQEVSERISRLRRAALLNEADIQAAKAAPRRNNGAGVAALPGASMSPYPVGGFQGAPGGINPALLAQLTALSFPRPAASASSPTLLPPIQERGSIMGPSTWRGNYGASSAYGSGESEQARASAARYLRNLQSNPVQSLPSASTAAIPTYQGGPSGGLPAVPPPLADARLELTPSGELRPVSLPPLDYNMPGPTLDQTPEMAQWTSLLRSLERGGMSAANPLVAPLSRDIARYLSLDPEQLGGSAVYRTPASQVSNALRQGSGDLAQQIQSIPVPVMREMLRSALREYQRAPTGQLPRFKFNI